MIPRKRLPMLIIAGLLLLSFGALATSCSSEKKPEKIHYVAPEIEVDEEEYEVYSDLIDIFYIQREQHGKNQNLKVLVIRAEAFPISISNLSMEERPKLEDSLIADLKAKEALGPGRIEDHFGFDVPVALVSSEEFSQIPGGWEGFYTKFPDSQGLMSLSRVGFNSDRTRALVHMSNRVASDCAGYRYVVLHKEYGDWIVRGMFGVITE